MPAAGGSLVLLRLVVREQQCQLGGFGEADELELRRGRPGGNACKPSPERSRTNVLIGIKLPPSKPMQAGRGNLPLPSRTLDQGRSDQSVHAPASLIASPVSCGARQPFP